MPLPKRPVHGLNDPNQMRRDRETLNDILTFRHDDSRVRTDAEVAAGVTPVNYAWPEGYVDRYGENTTPGTTDMTAAIQVAVNVAHAKGTGGNVYFLPATYKTTSAIVFPLTSVRIYMHGNGAYIQCDHNGDGIYWIVSNENYSGHVIENLTINGPNDHLPTTPGGYSPPSLGAGIQMNRSTTDNIVTAYNNTLRDVTIMGFQIGIGMRACIGLNVHGSFFQYNQYGVYFSGGQSNANHFFGCHIRYNRISGVRSDGATGGSLTNATANVFIGCLIESNIAYEEGNFVAGGSPPTNNTAIYLNNSYDFLFDGCYMENHSATIYLTGGSKFNRFKRCSIFPGGGGTRLGTIYLDGAGVFSNEFDINFYSNSATEVNVVANSSSQLYNQFTGTGMNFIAGSIIAPLDYNDVKPSLNYTPAYGIGLVRMPSQGYKANVNPGTDPGQINGIGTTTASVNLYGIGELTIGNGITGNTTITTVSGLSPNSLLVLRSNQATYAVTLSASAFGNANGQPVIFNASGQVITYWVNGDGFPREIGRNFSNAGAYTVTNGSLDRSLNVTGDTLAQVAAVLGTLLADLQGRGIIN